jgi:hypothetical protein
MKRFIAFIAVCICLLAPSLYAQMDKYGAISVASTDCSTANSCVVFTVPSTASAATITVNPTYSGTLQFEASGDGDTWVANTVYPYASGSGVTSTTSTGTWGTPVAGLKKIRVRGSAVASGTANIFMNASTGAYAFGSSATVSGTVNQGAAGADPWLTTGPVAEDAAAGNGDRGFPVLFKRCDTAASSSASDGDYTQPCVDATGKIWVNSGDEAAEGAAPNLPPVFIAGRADTTEPPAVNDGDKASPFLDAVKKTVTSPYAASDYYWSACGDGETGTSEEVLIAADANLRFYVTWVSCTNTDTDNDTSMLLVTDGASGTNTRRFPCPGGSAANRQGGFVFGLPTPIPMTAVNKAVVAKAETASTTAYFCAGGYKSAR